MMSHGFLSPLHLRHSLWLVLLLSTCPLISVHGQHDDAATLASEALSSTVHQYDTYFGKNLSIYTGPQYAFNYAQVGGNQYFIDDYWEQGRVVYEGQVYDSVFMKYDVFNDLIVVEHFGEKGLVMSIQLFSPKINSFTLHDHYFERLAADSAGVIREGFYDILFGGKQISAMVKRQKEIVRTTSTSTLADDFVGKDRHFLYKGGLYYPVKKRGSVIKVLHDHKKEVKNFVRTNKLFFMADRDRDLRIVAQYYESLF